MFSSRFMLFLTYTKKLCKQISDFLEKHFISRFMLFLALKNFEILKSTHSLTG